MPSPQSLTRKYGNWVAKYKKIERMERMEISKMLILSTAHITEKTAKELDYAIGRIDSGVDLCVYEKKDYGYFVHIPDDWDERIIPSDLVDCLRLAVNDGCEWLCLDRDGEITSLLFAYKRDD